ncbi:MAG TPA: hypothetical protein VII21_04775 [Aestuariivirga sp.]
MLKIISHFAVIAAIISGSTVAKAESSIYFGRWTNGEDKPVYSSRGILYKTIDIAPCGADFCGVSVDDKMGCGPILFRFLMIHANTDYLTGHGRWGNDKLKVILTPAGDPGPKQELLIGLGDQSFDFEGREGSMPKFRAQYKNIGDAKCIGNVGS